MTDGDALLRTILERPHDDTARLVYADWLEDVEGGNDAARAEFVRVQVEVSRRHTCDCAPSLFVEPDCPVCDSVRPLWYKRSGLISGIYDQFRPAVPYSWAVLMGATRACDTPASFVNRGFVSEIHLPLAAFMEHAKTLFSSHPITAVRLTDRQPHEWTDWEGHPELPGTDVFSWYGDPGYGQFDVGRELMGEQGESDHATREDALAWLSARCVAYGRSLAGLSSLVSA